VGLPKAKILSTNYNNVGHENFTYAMHGRDIVQEFKYPKCLRNSLTDAGKFATMYKLQIFPLRLFATVLRVVGGFVNCFQSRNNFTDEDY
jgi:hypothetical protein